MVVPDASRSRHVAFLKQSCGFSTQVRNGICCRKTIPTTKRNIGAFRLGEPNPRPRECHIRNFLGFVQLACLVILFKRF
jgi:hypothetical protein